MTRPQRATTIEGARPFPGAAPALLLEDARYRARLADGAVDLDAALRLRYAVFNVELGEGLASSHDTGRDEDRFDATCDHLLIEDGTSGAVVGTYRMQTAEMAARGAGFYSAGEFTLEDLPPEVLRASVEIGRACIAAPHRNRRVLFLLWRGLAAYLSARGKRYLFGCCSLTGTDPAVGLRALRLLRGGEHLHPALRVSPRPGFECVAGDRPPEGAVEIPLLFRTYLRHGAKVCGGPALDREFGTTDFFVLLDVERLDPDLRRLYFR